MKNKEKIFSRLINYTKSYKLMFVLAALGHVLYMGMDFLFITSFESIIESLNKLDNNPKETLSNISFLKWMPVYVVFIILIRGAGGFISSYCMTFIGQGIVKKMRDQLIENYIKIPTEFYDSTSSGELVSKITFNVQQIADASTNALTKIIRDGGLILLLIGYLFYKDWRLALIFFTFIPVIAFIVKKATKRFKLVSQNIQDSMGDITQAAHEIISNHKLIKSFNGQKFESERFSFHSDNNRVHEIKLNVAKAISTPVIQFITSFAIAGVMYFAIEFISDKSLKPSEFAGMIIAMMALLKPIKSLSDLNQVIQQGLIAAKSVFDIIDESKENKGPKLLDSSPKTIEFKNINFSYKNSTSKALNNISFKIKSKSTFALVGKSGSGKSTIVDLILKFYEANAGQIKIDNVNINEYSLESLRDNISFVSQDITLFNDSISSNIAYGEKDVNYSKLIDAAEKANASEFINKLKNKYNAIIGENGSTLSGGQRQRIAIARAIYKDSPIIILDEATSALDTESEKYIQKALENLMKNKTTLVIAHRLSTIENADYIAVMEDGKIIEQGNHQSLLIRGKKYAKLHSKKFSK
jgi:subfamily B ATP-binding cassette protein MsbA